MGLKEPAFRWADEEINVRKQNMGDCLNLDVLLNTQGRKRSEEGPRNPKKKQNTVGGWAVVEGKIERAGEGITSTGTRGNQGESRGLSYSWEQMNKGKWPRINLEREKKLNKSIPSGRGEHFQEKKKPTKRMARAEIPANGWRTLDRGGEGYDPERTVIFLEKIT